MSSNLPPTGPPSGPPSGPPGWGPPTGPPPAAPPTQVGGTPEFLDSGAGGAVPPQHPVGSSGGGRKRRGLLVGGGVVGVLALTGGAFAFYQAVLATGPQPAEALPDSTVAYLSVDLDPSGQQKLEALETLEQFPAFEENVDIDSEDDLRQKLFEYVQDDAGVCADVSWADDVEPWLGDRFAVAAVDVGEELAGNESGVTGVGVLQVSDGDAAEEGLAKLRDCAAGESDGSSGSDESGDPESSDMGGWSVSGDWVVVAESDEVAAAVTEAAEESSLADDGDYEKWTDEAGDAGILTAYAAPEAGDLLVDGLGSGFMGGYGDVACGPVPSTDDLAPEDDFEDYEEDFGDDYGCETGDDSGPDESEQALRDAFADFEGGALTVRFDDGGVEVESASSVDFTGLQELYTTERGDDVVASLPDETAIAVGLGFEEGWFTSLTDYLETSTAGMLDVEEGLALIEEETGLSLPEDAETLAGDSAAVAISGDVDFSADEPTDQPVGIKVQGEPDDITAIVEQLLDNPDVDDELRDTFSYDSEGEHVAGGFSEDWNARLLEGGDLGDTDAYRDVVRESDDAAAVVYVNFDEGGWLDRVLEEDDVDQEVRDNVAPLEAVGMSVWSDDDVSHSVIRLTTE